MHQPRPPSCTPLVFSFTIKRWAKADAFPPCPRFQRPARRRSPAMGTLAPILGPNFRRLYWLQGACSSSVRKKGSFFCVICVVESLKWIRAWMLRQVCQLRARFVKGSSEQAALWERQHEVAAEKIYSLCYQLGGFFLKVCFWVFFSLSWSL